MAGLFDRIKKMSNESSAQMMGALAGFVCAILVITIGFGNTLLVIVLTAGGFLVGCLLENGGSLTNCLNRFKGRRHD
jgi:uncharacterized membrane protein